MTYTHCCVHNTRLPPYDGQKTCLRVLQFINQRMHNLLLISIRLTPSHCSTTHSHTTWYAATTPRLQIGIECEYRNITLVRNKAPWWRSDKIETGWSVLMCFKSVLYKIILHSLVDELKWFRENERCYNKIYEEFYSKNKFEKLVHLVGFIIIIYHGARSSEW